MAIYVAGTCDTKGRELAYVKELIVADGVAAFLVDLSTSASDGNFRTADISSEAVAQFHLQGAGAVFTGDRGTAVLGMAEAFERFMLGRDDVSGLIGLGGSGGTALVTPAMRALAVGIPKLMVSTVASGNVAPYVGASDIAMMYSVTDVAGLNRISRVVLANAAHAIAGMVRAAMNLHVEEESADKPSLGITMFGVTTPCVTELARVLESAWDCLVFHATGTGGRAMEKLVDSRLMMGVIDVTTTEVADLLMGGVFPCGEDRFGAIRRTEAPCVVSCGALDMVNFGAIDTVPEAFRQRLLYRHNPQVTLMRTTPEENARIGEWIAERLDRCSGPLRIVIPEGGVSALDAPGMPFADPAADAVLFSRLEKGVRATASRQVVRLPLHINDPAFAGALAAQFTAIAGTA